MDLVNHHYPTCHLQFEPRFLHNWSELFFYGQNKVKHLLIPFNNIKMAAASLLSPTTAEFKGMLASCGRC